jgi:hypothetical protein
MEKLKKRKQILFLLPLGREDFYFLSPFLVSITVFTVLAHKA